MNRFITKIISCIILGIIPIGLSAQNMIWIGTGMTIKSNKYKTYIGVEERVYIPLKQKDFMEDYRFTYSAYKIMPVLGFSAWDHAGKAEMRPYWGLDSKYFRVLMEHRFYYNGETVNRLRARVSYKYNIKEWFLIQTSEELFWTKEFDHNRFILGIGFKWWHFDLDCGYMSYYKDENQNTLVVKLNYNL